MALLPPGGPLEVVFSFDTTGSMYSWLDELRGRIQDMIQRLQADIPGIRMSVFAHGDYCDAHIYVTKWVDLTNDIAKLCKFVKNVKRTGGGDAPECYELVLRQVRTELSWTRGSRRVLVMIGDDNPHEPHEACNTDKIDWREEVKSLAEEDVAIYGVQCGNNVNADKFYQAISLATGGKHLRLADFGSIFDTLMAVCYREGSHTAMLASYEKEVRARCGKVGLAKDIDAIFASLRDDGADRFTLKKDLSVLSDMPTAVVKKSKGLKTHKISAKKSPRTKKTVTKKSGLDKFKARNLPLLKRENVPENNFNLRSLNWHQWTLAIVKEEEVIKTRPEIWEKRQSGLGYRLKRLGWSNSSARKSLKKSILYEFAVQGSGNKKKRYVVLSGFSRSLGARMWERRLLGKSRSQVDLLLKAGGRVYVRFCFVDSKSVLESSKRDMKRYDYAWSKIRKVRECPRDVVKGGVTISSSKLSI